MESTQELGAVKKTYFFKPLKNKLYKKLKIKNLNASKLSFYLFLLLVVILGTSELIKILDGSGTSSFVENESINYQTSLDIDSSGIVLTNKPNSNKILGVNTSTNISSNIGVLDQRAYVFDQYFLANNSPLYGYGKLFVEKCDQYGSPKDCITIIAIARNESNLCKYDVSAKMHNCWGFGGGGEYRINFSSFEESIDRVSRVLMEGYGPRYIIDPSLMEGTFCGPQDECKNWGNSIKFFIREIEEFSKSIGVGSLLALRN